MARPLRFQYPGAIYHVMVRGDGGNIVFQTDDGRLFFLKRFSYKSAPTNYAKNLQLFKISLVQALHEALRVTRWVPIRFWRLGG
jgi:hypothetical protein